MSNGRLLGLGCCAFVVSAYFRGLSSPSVPPTPRHSWASSAWSHGLRSQEGPVPSGLPTWGASSCTTASGDSCSQTADLPQASGVPWAALSITCIGLAENGLCLSSFCPPVWVLVVALLQLFGGSCWYSPWRCPAAHHQGKLAGLSLILSSGQLFEIERLGNILSFWQREPSILGLWNLRTRALAKEQ